MNTTIDPLVAFFEGKGRTGHGKKIDEILSYSDRELECDHQYIQWLFPNRHPSRYNPSAPTLNAENIANLRASVEAMQYLSSGLDRMIKFYDETDHWIGKQDHNHLRITRIIETIIILVGYDQAKSFRDFILSRDAVFGNVISETSKDMWANRLSRLRELQG